MAARRIQRGWSISGCGMAAAWLTCASPLAAQDEPPEEEPEPTKIDVSIFGEDREVERVAGSAHRIDEEELERNEDDDPHKPLMRVPGVYARGEDGFGLRPNIGLRGASSDRSSKVTLMEDGVLLAPAPYAAPAAYYFPLLTRMSAVEVFKGPSALRHGPHTIGGAINMVSRRIPYGHSFGADLAFGNELYGKGHGYYGYGTEHWGVVLEAVRLRSNGFKELDAPPDYGERPDTGFDKIELVGKARINTAPVAPVYNEANIKVGWSREVSNESYLGLTDADFEANPRRRYAASQLDHMDWERTAIELTHALVVREDDTSPTLLSLRTTAYRHDFHRLWARLDGFDGEPELLAVLADPTGGREAVRYQVLTGASDSTDTETLRVANNDRTFVAQGIQTSGALTLPELGPIGQRVRFGLRLHYDEALRRHTPDDYATRGGRMVRLGPAAGVDPTDSLSSATAVAAYLVDEIALYRLLVTPGIRVEHIFTHFEDYFAGETVDGRQRAFLPGVGAYYQIIDELAVLAGVHEGFSPVSPGQHAGVQPEVAVNYEGGARFSWKWLGAEAIGFFSDYSNIVGQTTGSTGGSEEQVGVEFNAGEAFIYGLEALARAEVPTPVDLKVPLSVTYTFTKTEFRSDFESEFPLWGSVQKGDELPYVPRHQMAASAGLVSERWGGFNLGATYVGAMKEQAGDDGPLAGKSTDAYVVFDASTWYQVIEELQLYLKMENILDEQAIVSRRPFGARPNRPRFFYGGIKVKIDRP